MKTAIEKIGGNYKVTFTHGVQTFTLDYSGAKKECQWYKDRLDECFKKYTSQQKPTDEEIKAYISKQPYYGTCTTEYIEGIEQGAKWARNNQIK